jgi:hypothetical protein
MTGKERVVSLLNGKKIDKQPSFDILRNDAIIEYLAGEKISFENAVQVTRAAVRNGFDSTRGVPKLPVQEYSGRLADGRKVQYQRWTRWVEHKKYEDINQYIRAKNILLQDASLTAQEIAEAKTVIGQYIACEQDDFGDLAFFWYLGNHSKEQFGFDGSGHVPMMLTDLYTEIGLEEFCYFISDDQALFSEILEWNTLRSIQAIGLIPEANKPFGIFLADDIAFKSGPLLSTTFFENEYFDRLRRIVEACHRRNILVMFHSDGNLFKVLDGLAAAGIDFLNPIEIAAGMDIKEIHRRYPQLIMAGGIDASQLLPNGSEREVRDAVKKAVDDADGNILVGSSTEIGEAVPLRNFIAMRESLDLAGIA